MKLTELEDLNCFPQLFRNMQTEFLAQTAIILNMYKPLNSLLFEFKKHSSKKIIDLCSGSGIPAIQATGELRKQGFKLICTDKFPNRDLIQQNDYLNVEYSSEPLDILNLPSDLTGVFTMFNSLHHFTPEENESLITELSRRKGAFFFAEPLKPQLLIFIKVILMTTIGQVIICPFIKPFRIERLIFTYLLPLNLVFTLYDGLISVFKSYKRSTLERLARHAQNEGFITKTGSVWYSVGNIRYLSAHFQ